MAFNQQGVSESDLMQVIRQNQVRTDESLTDMQRKLQQQAEENSRLRGMLNETANRTEQRIDSLLTEKSSQQAWESDDWANSFGGSPREQAPQTPQAPSFSREEVAKLVEQQIQEREYRRQQQQQEAVVQDNRDGQRLWNKFQAEHPDLAGDEIAVLRLHQNWTAAKAMNARADDNHRLSTDQLYGEVVSHLRQQKQAEAQYYTQQQAQQVQQQPSMGPFEQRRRNLANPQESYQQPQQPPSYGNQQFQMTGAQRTPQPPVQPGGGHAPPSHQQAALQQQPAMPYPSGGTPMPSNGAPQGAQAGNPLHRSTGDAHFDNRYSDYQNKKFRRPI